MSFTKEPDLPAEAPKRKFKASDLPLSSVTRSAIENLAHTFKKKGGYDVLRKQVWEKFEASVRNMWLPTCKPILTLFCLSRITKRSSRKLYLRRRTRSSKRTRPICWGSSETKLLCSYREQSTARESTS
jgi:hypothetical protein